LRAVFLLKNKVLLTKATTLREASVAAFASF
jgi:hypothetical protein